MIDPLGLVVKQGNWYVLASTLDGQRSFRIDRIVDAALTAETFDRPPDFDLEHEWARITTDYVARSSRVTTRAVATDLAVTALRSMGVETVVHGPLGADRWDVTLGAWNARVLAVEIAGVVDLVELIDPPDEVVANLAEIGARLVERFGPSGALSRGQRSGQIGRPKTATVDIMRPTALNPATEVHALDR